MPELKDFLITRHIPGVANWDAATRQSVAAASNAVVTGLNEENGSTVYEWDESVATGPNTLVCHHRAVSADMVRDHSKRGGFPCDEVIEGNMLPSGTMRLGPGDAHAVPATAVS